MTRNAVAAASALLLLAGCATMIRGTEQEVSVNTNPVGAKIEFSNGQSCVSPCHITTARDQSLLVTISKENCGTQTATMVPTLAGEGVLLGGIVDYGTGAVYDLQPNPMTVTLMCTDVGAAPSPTGSSPSQETKTVPPAASQGAPPVAASGDLRRREIEAMWATKIGTVRGLYCTGPEGDHASECVEKVALAEGARDAELRAFDTGAPPSQQN
jgi:hypothetical protein